MNFISSLIIPILVFGIVGYGIYKKVNVYDVFIEGAVESFDMIIKIFLRGDSFETHGNHG